MSQLLTLLRQHRRFGGYLVLCFTKCSLPLAPLAAKMSCAESMQLACKESMEKFRDFAFRVGACLARCWGQRCACSACLPSAESVCLCVGRVFSIFFLVVCCPFVGCWFICRVIWYFRNRGGGDRRGSYIQDDGTRQRHGYNTFQNGDADDGESQRAPGRNFRQEPQNKNYMFYTNQRKSEPDGDYIDVILKDWRGQYGRLEHHHGFIQWLFPLYESGVNYRAQPLNNEERQEIMEDETACRRIVEAYKLMLDFYGIELVDDQTGELRRSRNYRERFRNLERNSHNCLRITRIIKCLRIFEYEQHALSFVKFFLTEIFQKGNLKKCEDSCVRFWLTSLAQDDIFEMQNYIRTLEGERAAREATIVDVADVMTDDEEELPRRGSSGRM